MAPSAPLFSRLWGYIYQLGNELPVEPDAWIPFHQCRQERLPPFVYLFLFFELAHELLPSVQPQFTCQPLPPLDNSRSHLSFGFGFLLLILFGGLAGCLLKQLEPQLSLRTDTRSEISLTQQLAHQDIPALLDSLLLSFFVQSQEALDQLLPSVEVDHLPTFLVVVKHFVFHGLVSLDPAHGLFLGILFFSVHQFLNHGLPSLDRSVIQRLAKMLLSQNSVDEPPPVADALHRLGFVETGKQQSGESGP